MTTLNNIQASKVTWYWPEWGSFRVDVTSSHGDPLPERSVAQLVMGTLQATAKVKRSGLTAVDKPQTVLIGGLGWHDVITAPFSFQNDGGVRLSTVLERLSNESGEPIEQPPDVTIGQHYVCFGSRLGTLKTWADALNELTREGYCPQWRVDVDGVTRFGPRKPIEITTRLTDLSKGDHGITTYAIDDPVQLAPGNTIGGVPIQRMDIRETDSKVEVDVYTAEGVPSLVDMVRKILADEMADHEYTYVVANCYDDGRCDLLPASDCPELSELAKVEQWLDGGSVFKAEPGDECTVGFRDYRRTRPVIRRFKKLEGTAFPGAARIGDMVQSGGKLQACNFSSPTGVPLLLVTPGLAPTPGPYLVSFGLLPGPVPPTPLSAGPLYGTIASGSKRKGVKTR